MNAPGQSLAEIYFRSVEIERQRLTARAASGSRLKAPRYTEMNARTGRVVFLDCGDRCMYTITELSRAAMKDIAKYIRAKWREKYRGSFIQRTKKGVNNINTYIPKAANNEAAHLEIGYIPGKVSMNAPTFIQKKALGWYAALQETGAKHLERQGLLFNAVNDNLDEIRKIEAQYLSAINTADGGESLIDESEAEGED